MRNTASTTIRKPKNKGVWIACGTCNKETCHKVLTSIEQYDHDQEADIRVWDNYMTVQCQGCKTISFYHESRCSEDMQFNEETQDAEIIPRCTLYLSRIVGRAALDRIYELPHGLARVYKQTHAAICNNLNVIAGIGMRAIVEAICNEKAAKGKDLKERIDELVNLGLITKDGATILHSIRLMGNKAAHQAKANSQGELAIALDVVEHLLLGVYILPSRAAELTKKPD